MTRPLNPAYMAAKSMSWSIGIQSNSPFGPAM